MTITDEKKPNCEKMPQKVIERIRSHWVVVGLGLLLAAVIYFDKFNMALENITDSGLFNDKIEAHVEVRDNTIAIKSVANEIKKESGDYNKQYSRQIPAELLPPILDIKIINNSNNDIFMTNINIILTPALT